MNKPTRGVFFGFIIVGIIMLILYFLPTEYLPPKATLTSMAILADTATPTFTDTFFVAHINIDSLCRSGTSEKFEVITTIPQDRDVMLIAKDSSLAEWLLIRWGSFPDCWIEGKFVTSNHIASLPAISTPYEPTFTPTATSTYNPTETFTPTQTRVVNLMWTNTKRPSDTSNNPVQTSTNALISPPSSPPDPTKTPVPTKTPIPPIDTPCPTNPAGHQPPGQCQ